MSREGPQRYAGGGQEQLSMRLVGGTGALVGALARDHPARARPARHPGHGGGARA
jgi:hypothetical protein